MDLTIVVQTKGGEGKDTHPLSRWQETRGIGQEIRRAVCTEQVNRVSIAIVVIMTAINIITTIIRLETLESLDRLKELEEHDDLKSKLLFSVIVVRVLLRLWRQWWDDDNGISHFEKEQGQTSRLPFIGCDRRLSHRSNLQIWIWICLTSKRNCSKSPFYIDHQVMWFQGNSIFDKKQAPPLF